ncbi:MAG: phosphoglycerate mutase family protein [Pseudomarimonas sp.]
MISIAFAWVKPQRVLAAACLLACCTHAHATPPFVVLVRHAEKQAEPASDDPELSAAGKQRAQQLAAALQDADIGVIITTQFKRTQATAAPLAKQRGLTPQVIAAGAGDAHILETAAAVRAQSRGVLVVGHSNTVTAIAKALGGPVLPNICDSSFSHALVLQLEPPPTRMLRLRYGAGDPQVTGTDCL